jgi:hypothetical protein
MGSLFPPIVMPSQMWPTIHKSPYLYFGKVAGGYEG